MATITVRDFSCIDSAEIEIRKVNVIIGPQGSGKSVITKLIYFLNDIIPNIIPSAEDGMTLNEFRKSIERSFTTWFPPQAWGDERFHIGYFDGEFNARILRRKIAGKLSDEVSIKLSSWIEGIYKEALDAFSGTSERLDEIGDDVSSINSLEEASRARSFIWSLISKTSKSEPVRSQVFIPAGRAFFTSIGRMVAGLEQGVSLDPATLKFARLFANWRDRSSYLPIALRSPDFQNMRREVMGEFFGGVVQSKRESEYIEMHDGRKVPFSSLSSGQQELLPIWYFLDHIMSVDERMRRRQTRAYSRTTSRTTELIYIEEPEAHLFPEAQCKLLDVLVSKVSGDSIHRKMIITTHSPYIMSRLNVLLKAGSISRRKKKNRALGKIVDRQSWLSLGNFSAFKIEDGEAESIIDEDEGLIDAQFLDEISDVISEDFEKLLELEEEI